MNFRKSLSAFFVLTFISVICLQVSWSYAVTANGAPISSAISTPISTAVVNTTSSLDPAGGTGEVPVCTNVKPAGAPKLLSVKQTGANQATLTWEKAKNPVTYYMVSYGLSKDTKMFGNPNIGDQNTTSYTVSHLSGNTTYYFKVRAGNGCMPGDFSNEIAIKIDGRKVFGNAGNFDSFVVASSKTYNYTNSVGMGQTFQQNIFANTPKVSPAERIFQSFGNLKDRVGSFISSFLLH